MMEQYMGYSNLPAYTNVQQLYSTWSNAGNLTITTSPTNANFAFYTYANDPNDPQQMGHMLTIFMTNINGTSTPWVITASETHGTTNVSLDWFNDFAENNPTYGPATIIYTKMNWGNFNNWYNNKGYTNQ